MSKDFEREKKVEEKVEVKPVPTFTKKDNHKANLLKSLNHIDGDGLKAKEYARIMKGVK